MAEEGRQQGAGKDRHAAASAGAEEEEEIRAGAQQGPD